MEVILYLGVKTTSFCCILHVCGGDPSMHNRTNYLWRYSPRMWRWSWDILKSTSWLLVFSTYVEVILNKEANLHLYHRILHVCGGDPVNRAEKTFMHEYSPRMWRWSLGGEASWRNTTVFSTYVEVIPWLSILALTIISILHVCGGDPILLPNSSLMKKYSPRMWRWS